MPSPLLPFYNTLLTFELNDGGLIEDEHGNWISDGTASVLEIKAFLKEAEDWSKRIHHHQSSLDGQSMFLEGSIVEPDYLPEHIILPQIVPAKYKITPSRWFDCQIELMHRTMPIPFAQDYIGQAVEAWLRWNK